VLLLLLLLLLLPALRVGRPAGAQLCRGRCLPLLPMPPGCCEAARLLPRSNMVVCVAGACVLVRLEAIEAADRHRGRLETLADTGSSRLLSMYWRRRVANSNSQ
jgi:hypothetical protein